MTALTMMPDDDVADVGYRLRLMMMKGDENPQQFTSHAEE